MCCTVLLLLLLLLLLSGVGLAAVVTAAVVVVIVSEISFATCAAYHSVGGDFRSAMLRGVDDRKRRKELTKEGFETHL